MKRGWAIGIVVLVLIVVGVLAFGGCFISSGCDVIGSEVMCSDSFEDRCFRLGGVEERCCLESLEEAQEKGWEVLPADCCFDEESGFEICRDMTCSEGYDMVSAMCKGSLSFCVKEEDSWEYWGPSPEDRCEELNGSERECCFDSLREFGRERVLPVDCWVTEDNKTTCVDFDCYSLYGKENQWDVVSWGCEGSLDFCVEESWDVDES